MSQQNLDWYELNKQRCYPLRSAFPVYGNALIIDAAFVVPNTYELPLKISKLVICYPSLCITVVDNNSKYVGNFNYDGTDLLTLSAPSAGCSGSLKLNLEEFYPTLTQQYGMDFLEGNEIEFEIKTVKLAFPSITEIEIDKAKEDDIKITSGDIIFEEQIFTSLEVEDLDNVTTQVTINSTQQIPPKCELYLPILNINGVTPDEQGIIKLCRDNLGISIQQETESILELRSGYNIVDFDKRALTASRGLSGVPGTPGEDGPDGNNTGFDVDYSGLFFDTATFRGYDAPAVDPHLEILFFDEIAIAIGPDIVQCLNTPANLRLTDVQCFDAIKYEDFIVLLTSDNKALKVTVDVADQGRLEIVEEKLLDDLNIGPVTDIATNGTSILYNNADFAVIEQVYDPTGVSSVYQLQGVTTTAGVITGATYNEPRGEYWILFETGAFQILEGNFVDLPITEELYDVWGNWIVGEAGTLYYTDGTPIGSIDYTQVGKLPFNINSIRGFAANYIIAVGDSGGFIVFDGVTWFRLGTPPNKNWNVIRFNNKTSIWIGE